MVGVDGLHLEVKRCEQLRIDEWIQQAERDSDGTGNIPVVVYRKSGQIWRVILPAEEFFRIYQKIKEERIKQTKTI